MYIKREQNYQDEILLLKNELADVKEQLKEEIERNRIEKEEMIRTSQEQMCESKTYIIKYRALVEKELEVLQFICHETNKDRQILSTRIKEMKKILRVPRLCTQFHN